MRYELALLVRRLLTRDGFSVEGPIVLTASRVVDVQVVAESEGQLDRIVELMQRWAPEAIRVGGQHSG